MSSGGVWLLPLIVVGGGLVAVLHGREVQAEYFLP